MGTEGARETWDTEMKGERGRAKVRRPRKDTQRWIKGSFVGDYLGDKSQPLPPRCTNHACICSLSCPRHPAVPDTQDKFLRT